MARSKPTPPLGPAVPAGAPNRRGSPEAVQKRRLARKLNSLLTRGGTSASPDGRTERRRRRLLAELAQGTRSPTEGLKPIEVLQHVHDLLELGETVTSLRKVVTVHPRPAIDSAEAKRLLADLQRSYNFRPESYQFLGLAPEALSGAGTGTGPGAAGEPQAPRRGRPPKAPR
jgi:hypothetical protein